ncbi:45850_t:CDS:2, partial [Gigaspora margarita]
SKYYKHYQRCRFGKSKENTLVDENSSKEPQVNTILQEILNRLELIENRQTGHTSLAANNL